MREDALFIELWGRTQEKNFHRVSACADVMFEWAFSCVRECRRRLIANSFTSVFRQISEKRKKLGFPYH